MGLFRKAVKQESKLRLAIMGPSGSGKTYSALAIGTALAGDKPVAVVDTENGSASKYSDIFEFDVAEMHAPFHPEKFVKAIQEATDAGYGVLIIDSMSHAWSGTGGVLDLVDEAAKRSKSGNTYTAWKEGTPLHNKLIDAIVQSGIHIIVTMRSKTEYVLVTNEKGRQTPQKVGMAPVQRDNTEYEFDVVFDMDIENNAIVSKSRCPALTGRVIAKPGAQVARILADWLSGTPVPQHAPTPPQQPATATEQPVATTTTQDEGDATFSRDGQGQTPPVAQGEEQGSPPHQRFWGIGKSAFGPDWDNGARSWALEKWSERHTPGNVRTSAKEFSDDEKTLIGDSIEANLALLQKAWRKHKLDKQAKQAEPMKQAA